ncbi:MAG: hypothetical protein ACNS62_07010 [Candidatus Cyclobacteriaceae bacterium M3_2C_046]
MKLLFGTNSSLNFSVVLCSMLLLSPALHAQDTFADWDQNEDLQLDEGEFNDNFMASDNSPFNDWDRNEDDLLDNDEVSTGIYNSWDTNMDDVLDAEEWNAGLNDSFGYLDETETDAFGDYDLDDDSFISQDEFGQISDENGYFDNMDQNEDAMLDENEYSRGFFETMDTNDDTFLDENELGESGIFDNDTY